MPDIIEEGPVIGDDGAPAFACQVCFANDLWSWEEAEAHVAEHHPDASPTDDAYPQWRKEIRYIMEEHGQYFATEPHENYGGSVNVPVVENPELALGRRLLRILYSQVRADALSDARVFEEFDNPRAGVVAMGSAHADGDATHTAWYFTTDDVEYEQRPLWGEL